MKFLHKDAKYLNITDDISLYEYCDQQLKLPIDGAYARINGVYGPKINKTFAELFFVISGRLEIEYNHTLHILHAKDMCILPAGTVHKICGYACEVFIACSPQFDLQQVDFCG